MLRACRPRSLKPPSSRSPREASLKRLPSNSLSWPMTHSSMRSDSSSTSSPRSLSRSMAGLAARRRHALGDHVIDALLPGAACARRTRRGSPSGSSSAWWVLAKRSRRQDRSLIGLILHQALLEHRAEFLPEGARTFPAPPWPDAPADPARAWQDRCGSPRPRGSCCSSSRETFSGRSLESTTPLTNRRYSGRNCSASSMMNTRRTYSFSPRAASRCHRSKGARAGHVQQARVLALALDAVVAPGQAGR